LITIFTTTNNSYNLPLSTELVYEILACPLLAIGILTVALLSFVLKPGLFRPFPFGSGHQKKKRKSEKINQDLLMPGLVLFAFEKNGKSI